MPHPSSVEAAHFRIVNELKKPEFLPADGGNEEPTPKRVAPPEYLAIQLTSPEYHPPQTQRPWSPPEPAGMLVSMHIHIIT